MEKEFVFEMLMQGDYEDIAPVAKPFKEKTEYSVIKAPRRELLMFQAEESVERIDFNVGEILVTSAEVRINDTLGYSMIMDINEEKALDCAVLMGVFEAGLDTDNDVAQLALSIKSKMDTKLREEREIISSSRVNFELMGGQDSNVSHNLEEDK